MKKGLINQDVQEVESITSLEVAEMVGREHNNVMKDIRRIIGQLGEVTSYQSYFIDSTYTNSQNKELLCYLLTKKGCELYATRMTGSKGTQFAVAYIERFNEIQQENKRLVEDNTQLHKIAVSDDEQKERQYQADKVRYSWKNIRTVLESCDYKTIEDEVTKIINFHTNDLKKRDRANYDSHQAANNTEYKQIVRDRVFTILDDITNTTLDGVLRVECQH